LSAVAEVRLLQQYGGKPHPARDRPRLARNQGSSARMSMKRGRMVMVGVRAPFQFSRLTGRSF